jgi:hypothetical protein
VCPPPEKGIDILSAEEKMRFLEVVEGKGVLD